MCPGLLRHAKVSVKCPGGGGGRGAKLLDAFCSVQKIPYIVKNISNRWKGFEIICFFFTPDQSNCSSISWINRINVFDIGIADKH